MLKLYFTNLQLPFTISRSETVAYIKREYIFTTNEIKCKYAYCVQNSHCTNN